MPPKSAKPAPRLLMPAEPPRDHARFTTTHLALLAVPIALWLLYGWLRPVPAIIIPPPAATAPAEVVPAAPPPPPAPSAAAKPLPSAEERVAAAVAADRATALPVAAAEPAAPAVLHYSEAGGNPLDRFPRAAGTWGNILNPGGNTPVGSYTVWYLNTGHSRQHGMGDNLLPRNSLPQDPEPIPAYTPQTKHVVARERTGSVSVNYSWSELHGIPSRQFAAYWAGRIRIPRRSLYSIKNKMSWARVRVILDGHILMDGEREKDVSLELDRGDHLLEVEYINAWHTTEFRLDITPIPTLRSIR